MRKTYTFTAPKYFLYRLFRRFFREELIDEIGDVFPAYQYEFIEMNDSNGRATAMSWETFTEKLFN